MLLRLLKLRSRNLWLCCSRLLLWVFEMVLPRFLSSDGSSSSPFFSADPWMLRVVFTLSAHFLAYFAGLVSHLALFFSLYLPGIYGRHYTPSLYLQSFW
jgi:hypothetical protein